MTPAPGRRGASPLSGGELVVLLAGLGLLVAGVYSATTEPPWGRAPPGGDTDGATWLVGVSLVAGIGVAVAGCLAGGAIGARVQRTWRHVAAVSLLAGVFCFCLGTAAYEATKPVGEPAGALVPAALAALSGSLAWRRPRVAGALLVGPAALLGLAFLAFGGLAGLVLAAPLLVLVALLLSTPRRAKIDEAVTDERGGSR